MEQLALLILFLVSGYLVARSGLAKSQDYKVLANIVFYICLPASILSSFAGVEIPPAIYLLIALLIASFLLSILLSFIISRALRLERHVFYCLLICGFFGNIVYFGFPFVQMVLGEAALPLAGIYVSIYNLFVFALLLPAIYILLGTEGKKAGIGKAFCNPVIIFTLAGALALALQINLSALMPYLEGFSSLTTPLSLLAMGLFLSDKSSISLGRNLLSIVAAKCLIFPLITFALLLYTGLLSSGKEILLLSLMPVAISNFVIVDSLGLKLEKLVMDSIVLTSVVSILAVFALDAIGIF
ncbi:MAG: AEC family transporter [Candidatus ainarchaeum sp.]|nr:AEC family transporter [Candidatus ainarchaeum sp.]MDD5096268.1 AEC family transporter [Candidatus ainarchaeum sp.]